MRAEATIARGETGTGAPHAHARIRRIDAAAARAAPGVLLVLTSADIATEIPRPIPSFESIPRFDIRGCDGRTAPDAAQYPAAGDRVRYVGEPVVFVVAETLAHAQDAADAIRVDYEPRLPVIGMDQALDPGTPRVWDEQRYARRHAGHPRAGLASPQKGSGPPRSRRRRMTPRGSRRPRRLAITRAAFATIRLPC